MTIKCQHLFSVLLAATFFLPLPGYSQGLPPTNMGKFVHQPGDNQYQPGAQVQRHGSEGYLDVTGCDDHRDEYRKTHPPAGASAGMMTVPAFTLAPPPPKGPDVSIEPIACEEPVPPAGFPPIPNNLDLPVQMGSTATGFGRGAWKNGGGAGGGGGGGRAQSSGSFEHYNHYEPGAFSKPKNNQGYRDDGGGGGDPTSYNPGAGVDGEASGFGGGGAAPPSRVVTAPAISSANNQDVVKSGYRVRTAPAPVRADRFDSQVGSGPTGRGAASASGGPSGGGRGAGSEKVPKLDDSQEESAKGAPEVPAAAGVFQAKSEDLTLPDDEYTSGSFKNGKSGRYVKQMAKRTKSLGRQMLRQTGVPFSF